MKLLNSLLLVCVLFFVFACNKKESLKIYNFCGDKTPIVRLTVNGKSGWFMLDTGADITMLNYTNAQYFGYSFKTPLLDHSISVGGIGGEANPALGIKDITIEAGTIIFESKIYAMDLPISVIEYPSGITLSGIIGTDILTKYKAQIDLTTNTVTFQE